MLAGHAARRRRTDCGFTLIELLIVVIILALLAAIVVIAVASTRHDAADNACVTDEKTLDHAEVTFNAHSQLTGSDVYGSESALVATHNLSAESSLHDIELDNGGATYGLVVQSPDCGDVGAIDKQCPSGVPPSPNPQGHLTCNPHHHH